MRRLDVGQNGIASQLVVGDRFRFHDGPDQRIHVVTTDRESHYEYDGRADLKLSKDVAITRVADDEGRDQTSVEASLRSAVTALHRDGDVAAWMMAMADVASRAQNAGSYGSVSTLDALERMGTNLFSQVSSLAELDDESRADWLAHVEEALSQFRSNVQTECLSPSMSDLRLFVRRRLSHLI